MNQPSYVNSKPMEAEHSVAANNIISEGAQLKPRSEHYSVDPTSTTTSLLPAGTGEMPQNSSTQQKLDRPIVVPATAAKLGSPFLRAYAPALESYHISKEVFLNFIDDLNRVAVKSPPLQVLGLAGSIVGFVPLATAQIVGNSINAASTLATILVSKGRTEMTLSEANKQLFEPRGLQVAIGKLDAVAAIAKIPDVLDDKGKINKKSPILPYMENEAQVHSSSGQQRRIDFLEPWIAHLDISPLPEIEARSNLLSQWSVSASEAQRKRQEKKMVKDRGESHAKYAEDTEKAVAKMEEELRKLDKEEVKAQRETSPDKVEKKLRKVDKERAKVTAEHEKELRKISEDLLKDDKEQESMRKVLFLIITEIGSGLAQS